MSIHFSLGKNYQIIKTQILCLINKDVPIYSLGRNIQDYSLTKHSDGWMDELVFYVPSTVFQSFRDDGRVNMKGSVQ